VENVPIQANSRRPAGVFVSAPIALKLHVPRGRMLLLASVLIVLFVIVLALGSVSIPLEDIARVLTGSEATKPSWTNIILKVRLPKALTAMLAGAALGLSGLLMQTFFRNPLAGPYVLGISSGASLGVAVVVLGAGGIGASFIAVFGLGGDLLLAGAAALGAAASMALVLLIARRVESSFSLLLLGVMFGYVTSALVSLLMYTGQPERIQAYTNWTFGSFSSVTWAQLPILAVGSIAGMLIAYALVKPLNVLLMGEAYAQTMGLNVERTRLLIIGATALLAGTVTAFCGPIGFIGTAVPHLCRALFNSSDHKTLVPATALCGAAVGLLSAVIAELPGSDATLPLNAVTALFGAPVVIYVILRQRNMQKAFGS
jgi:iron complex transport system permease protein